MEQLQPYQLEHAVSFESVRANTSFKEENTLMTMRGLGQWELSQNPAGVVAESAAETPFNVLSEATVTKGLLLSRQEVE